MRETRDQVDARLTAVFRDVPTPEGLADRLLDRLAIDRAASPRDFQETPAAGRAGKTRSRRWLLVGGSVLAVAAAVLAAVWLGANRLDRLSEQAVLDLAIRSLDVSGKGGQLLTAKSAPEEYPFSQLVSKTRSVTWRRVDDFLGRRGVVYNMAARDGTRANLYVIAGEVEGLGGSPARHPFTTAGCCASAWREGNLAYVLVVHGNQAAYEGFLNLPRTPVALAGIVRQWTKG